MCERMRATKVPDFAALILRGLAVCLLMTGLPVTARPQDTRMMPDSVQVRPHKEGDWNEFNAGWTTIRLGMAAIYETSSYDQDAIGEAQMDSANVTLKRYDSGWRDFRFFANGKLNTKRPYIWKIAGMYDGVYESWTFRETGLLIGVPEWHSEVFVGRSKEGYSLNKVQNGYSCWGHERQMWLDNIPIMTDGIRWYGYLPKSKFLWSAGAFTDAIYEAIKEDTRFAPWDWQLSGRVGWRPIYSGPAGDVLHLGINARSARPDEGVYRVRSKPESNLAPNFIDTGQFKSDASTALGIEAYYRKGPMMVGTEINELSFRSAQAGDPTYPGGDVLFSYLFKATRPYLSTNSVFFFPEPDRSLFDNGFGGLEFLLRYSWFDLNDGNMPGGMFWKVTPMINWYVDPYLRIEVGYGIGKLDRFGESGTTQFFQTRFQLQVM